MQAAGSSTSQWGVVVVGSIGGGGGGGCGKCKLGVVEERRRLFLPIGIKREEPQASFVSEFSLV